MSALLSTVTVVCIVANVFIVAADLARAQFVLVSSAEVGLRAAVLPRLAVLKGAGALGVVLGLAGVPALGLAAATGLVLFYVGAVTAHVRASVLHNIAFPLAYLALAVGAVLHFGVIVA